MAGAVHPHELATGVPGVALFVSERMPAAAPVEVTLFVLTFPLESTVQLALGVWIVVVPPPVTQFVLVRLPDPTTVTVPPPPPPDPQSLPVPLTTPDPFA